VTWIVQQLQPNGVTALQLEKRQNDIDIKLIVALLTDLAGAASGTKTAVHDPRFTGNTLSQKAMQQVKLLVSVCHRTDE